MLPEAQSFGMGHTIDASKGFNQGLDELLSKLKEVTHYNHDTGFNQGLGSLISKLKASLVTLPFSLLTKDASLQYFETQKSPNELKTTRLPEPGHTIAHSEPNTDKKHEQK